MLVNRSQAALWAFIFRDHYYTGLAWQDTIEQGWEFHDKSFSTNHVLLNTNMLHQMRIHLLQYNLQIIHLVDDNNYNLFGIGRTKIFLVFVSVINFRPNWLLIYSSHCLTWYYIFDKTQTWIYEVYRCCSLVSLWIFALNDMMHLWQPYI